MTKDFETQATKTSAASWSKFNVWLNLVFKFWTMIYWLILIIMRKTRKKDCEIEEQNL
jgi:hypothetical protein